MPDLSPSVRDDAPATGHPSVSVIIPAFNARAFIIETIQSVFSQAYTPIELLLIDDGSTDGTADLVRQTFPQVRIIRQKNSGVAAARNTGLREATGEYICFLDADDGWLHGKLHAQVAHLQKHPDVGLVYHNWLVWMPDDDGVHRWPDADPSEQPASVVAEESGWLYNKLLLDCMVHTSTVMLRRDIAQQIGFFDTELPIGEDYDYWLRVSRLCRIDKLSPVYSCYRVGGGGSLTQSLRETNFEYLVVSRAVDNWGKASEDEPLLSEKTLSERLAKLAFDFGYAHYHAGKCELARKSFMQTLKHKPTHWRAALYFFRSISRM